jgi:hypothetical protein
MNLVPCPQADDADQVRFLMLSGSISNVKQIIASETLLGSFEGLRGFILKIKSH